MDYGDYDKKGYANYKRNRKMQLLFTLAAFIIVAIVIVIINRCSASQSDSVSTLSNIIINKYSFINR